MYLYPMNKNTQENLSELSESAERLLSLTARSARSRLLTWESLTLVCFLALGFWLTFLIDWFIEPGWLVRLAVLVCFAVWFSGQAKQRVWFAWRHTLSRQAAAQLCQKYFPEGAQELVTAAAPAEYFEEWAESSTPEVKVIDSEAPSELWNQVRQNAQEYADRVLALPWRQKIFERRRFFQNAALAAVLLGSIAGFGAVRPELVRIWFHRIVCLSNEQWPRQVRIWVDGFENQNNPVGTLRIVRGDDLRLKVWADTNRPAVPERVSVLYRDSTGRFIRAAMVRQGDVRPGFGQELGEKERTGRRGEPEEAGKINPTKKADIKVSGDSKRQNNLEFSYTIRGVLAPLSIDFRGGDATLNDLTIEVVDSPIVARGELIERFAGYLRRKERNQIAGAANRISEGSAIRFVGWGNKPLKSVHATLKSGEGTTTELSARFVEIQKMGEGETGGSNQPVGQPVTTTVRSENGAKASRSGLFSPFEIELGVCESDSVLTIDLVDADGLESRRSAVYRISAASDAVPLLSAEPKGLGVACTKEARIPFGGTIQDDYGIATVRMAYEISRKDQKKSGNILKSDYRPEANLSKPGLSLPIHVDWKGEFCPSEVPLEWGDLVTLTVEATDLRQLKTPRSPDCGQAAPLTFEVVTSDRMRMILEASELNLRRQFETVFDEFRSTRDLLATLQTSNSGQAGQSQEKQNQENKDSDKNKIGTREESQNGTQNGTRANADRADEFQILHADRTVQNVGKNSQEFLAIAEGFRDVVDQMVNNLIDTPEWKQRLSDGIAKPLEKIGRETLPQLQQRALELRKAMENGQADLAAKRKTIVQEQFAEAVAQLDAVLGKMLQMEDFNEAIELLRQIIQRQEGLESGMKKKQKQSLEDLL